MISCCGVASAELFDCKESVDDVWYKASFDVVSLRCMSSRDVGRKYWSSGSLQSVQAYSVSFIVRSSNLAILCHRTRHR